MTPELSQRDKLMLAMLALAEIDDRLALASLNERNQINFSGTLAESKNLDYLEQMYQTMSDWPEDKLRKFALSMMGENPS